MLWQFHIFLCINGEGGNCGGDFQPEEKTLYNLTDRYYTKTRICGKKSSSQESKQISASEPEYMAFYTIGNWEGGQNITGHLANQNTRKLCLHTRSFKQRENHLEHN